jgi:hypothetical protein
LLSDLFHCHCYHLADFDMANRYHLADVIVWQIFHIWPILYCCVISDGLMFNVVQFSVSYKNDNILYQEILIWCCNLVFECYLMLFDDNKK